MPRGSIRQNICWIRYAARHYHQNPRSAVGVARCESRFDERVENPSHHKGLFQFDRPTWMATPFAKPYKARHRITGAVLKDKHGRSVRRRHSVFVAKYNALGAMWYWHLGQYSRWAQTMHCA